MQTRQRSLLILVAMLLALTAVFMLDDVIFYLLFERALGWQLRWFVKVIIVVAISVLNLGLAVVAIKALREKPRTGAEGMLGATGTVKSVTPPFCWVMVRGELWRARSDETLAVGDGVIVRNLQGLTLQVKREHKSANGGKA